MNSIQRLSIVPTMRCTLKCKLCSNHMSEFKNPKNVPLEEILQDIDSVFELFDHIGWFQFVGGEIGLNPDMGKVYRHSIKYKDKFDLLVPRINGTLLFQKDELEALHELGQKVKVVFSDYGPVSRKSKEIIAQMEEYEIPYDIKKYYGEDQHFGGWVDNSGLCDLGETEEEVVERAAHCPQVRIENMHCYRGKLHRCSNSLFLYELGLFDPNPNDFLDMRDKTLSQEEKFAIISAFYTHPRKSCHFCTWKNAAERERFSAAEQIIDNNL